MQSQEFYIYLICELAYNMNLLGGAAVVVVELPLTGWRKIDGFYRNKVLFIYM